MTTEDGKRAIDAAKTLPVPDPAKAAIFSAAEWVDKGVSVAQSVVYSGPVGMGKGPYLLLNTYEDKARMTAQQQAVLAAARLAGLINADLYLGSVR